MYTAAYQVVESMLQPDMTCSAYYDALGRCVDESVEARVAAVNGRHLIIVYPSISNQLAEI